MICVSLQKENVNDLLRSLEKCQLAEVRFEKLQLGSGDMEKIFSSGCEIIATNRPSDQSEEMRAGVLIDAIRAGAKFVDVEVESTDAFTAPIIDAAQNANCQLIVSYHNYEETPTKDQLDAIIDQCFAKGADIAKVACLVRTKADGARLLSLLDRPKIDSPQINSPQINSPGTILPIGMGDTGKITRIAAPLLGSPFTFAYANSEGETAPGQYSESKLQSIFAAIAAKTDPQ